MNKRVVYLLFYYAQWRELLRNQQEGVKVLQSQIDAAWYYLTRELERALQETLASERSEPGNAGLVLDRASAKVSRNGHRGDQE